MKWTIIVVCRHREFMDRVPEDRDAFMQALHSFYAEHETEMPKPVVRCAGLPSRIL